MRAITSPSVLAYRQTPRPAPATPWREAEFCVIDLEMTGLDPAVDEIISYATLAIIGGRLRLSDKRHQLVRPRRMPDATTIPIHGLMRSDLIDAPPLDEALDGLLEALTGRVLVAHVASVERGFLEAALEARGLRLTNPIVDTAELAAVVLRRGGRTVRRPIGLTPLAGALNLPVHRPHQADGDALTTAQAFLALVARLDAMSPQTVGSLQRHGTRPLRPAVPAALRRALARLSRADPA
jgi:DNA polymerase-3 subunit epsilon